MLLQTDTCTILRLSSSTNTAELLINELEESLRLSLDECMMSADRITIGDVIGTGTVCTVHVTQSRTNESSIYKQVWLLYGFRLHELNPFQVILEPSIKEQWRSKRIRTMLKWSPSKPYKVTSLSHFYPCVVVCGWLCAVACNLVVIATSYYRHTAYSERDGGVLWWGYGHERLWARECLVSHRSVHQRFTATRRTAVYGTWRFEDLHTRTNQGTCICLFQWSSLL